MPTTTTTTTTTTTATAAVQLQQNLRRATMTLWWIGLCCLVLLNVGSSFSVEQNSGGDDGRRSLETHGLHAARQYKVSPLASLLMNSNDDRMDILKRDKSSKPSSCTCTCVMKEAGADDSTHTAASAAGGTKATAAAAARDKLKTAEGKKLVIPTVHQHPQQDKGGKPASCTCTCESRVISGQHMAADSPADFGGNHHQDLESHPSRDSSTSDTEDPSLFWPSEEEGKEGPEGGEGEEVKEVETGKGPESAARESGKESESDRDQGSWGHASRYPWQRLPDHICYRDACQSDSDCCLRYNLCDRSAHVCTDCWYGASCITEKDCCYKYPHCQRDTYPAPGRAGSANQATVVVGKCVDK